MSYGVSRGSAFHVPPRTVLSFDAADWQLGNIPVGPLTISVDRVRWELANNYDAHVWLDGYQTDASGIPFRWVEILVQVEALRRGLDDNASARKAS